MTTSRASDSGTTMARPANTRTGKQERRNRDQNVMEAAITVMSERGYAATSVQEIADRVGVLKGSLYHYFSSKEELLFRVLAESHAQADKIAEEVRALELEPIDELSEFLRRLCHWFLTHVDRANIYFTETKQLTGDRFRETQRMGKHFVKQLEDMIVAAKDSGQVSSPMDITLLTDYVLGSLNSVRAWPTRSGKKYSKEQMADAFVELTRQALQVSAPGVSAPTVPAASPSPAPRRRTSSASRSGRPTSQGH
jgi:AcrR family transcriptional regulator